METKYTTDGKKVAVVGKLNSTEWIVQEIFVTGNGGEIPSGENFTVKSLHDEPVVPWKNRYECECKRLEEQYKRDADRLREAIDRQEKSLQVEYSRLYAMIKDLQSLASHLEKPESRLEFVRFLDFLSGKIEWVVVNWHPVPKIIKFNDLELCQSWNGKYDGIKLITVFGKSNGRLDYRLGMYRDDSGGSTEFHPFATYEEAFEKFREILLSKDITCNVLETAKEYGITLDGAKLTEYLNRQEDEACKGLQSVEKRKGEIVSCIEKIRELCKVNK